MPDTPYHDPTADPRLDAPLATPPVGVPVDETSADEPRYLPREARPTPPRQRDVSAFEVVSWVLIAVVGVAAGSVAILFGVPAAVAVLVLVAIGGGIWWWKVAGQDSEPPADLPPTVPPTVH